MSAKIPGSCKLAMAFFKALKTREKPLPRRNLTPELESILAKKKDLLGQRIQVLYPSVFL